MTRFLIMFVTGVVLFGAAATASWFLRPAPVEPEESAQAELAPTSRQPTSQQDVTRTSVTHHGEHQPGSLPAETVLRLNDSIRQREKHLLDREKLLEERQRQLTFMIDEPRPGQRPATCQLRSCLKTCVPSPRC